MSFETILLEAPAAGVGLIRFNRPRQYNALNSTLLGELGTALERFESDDSIHAVIITGSEKAFAAGADISEMDGMTGDEMLQMIQSVSGWHAISKCKKITLCAVSAMALGGGFELALQADILMASKGAKFALPEVNLGVIPGAGGTQRVARLVGKSLAMEMVLNVRPMLAEEALAKGIVSRVVEIDKLEEEAVKLASQIAARAPLAVLAGKACVNKAIDSTLEEGLVFEKQSFFPLFDSDDAKRLMGDFLNKNK